MLRPFLFRPLLFRFVRLASFGRWVWQDVKFYWRTCQGEEPPMGEVFSDARLALGRVNADLGYFLALNEFPTFPLPGEGAPWPENTCEAIGPMRAFLATERLLLWLMQADDQDPRVRLEMMASSLALVEVQAIENKKNKMANHPSNLGAGVPGPRAI